MLGRGRKTPFPASPLAPPGSGPRPAPFCSRWVQGLGGCGAARTWGWPGGGGEQYVTHPEPSLQRSARGQTRARSLATAREPGPQMEMGWSHGWEAVMLTDAWSERVEMEKEMYER